MIGTGTPATVPYNIYVASTTQVPTGGWDTYDSVAYAYYSMGPSKVEPLDPRKNPKNWALWFREFLASIFPGLRNEAVIPAEPVLLAVIVRRCRSGTMPVREWKMKNWIQALRAD